MPRGGNNLTSDAQKRAAATWRPNRSAAGRKRGNGGGGDGESPPRRRRAPPVPLDLGPGLRPIWREVVPAVVALRALTRADYLRLRSLLAAVFVVRRAEQNGSLSMRMLEAERRAWEVFTHAPAAPCSRADGRARKRDPKAIDESELPPPEPFKRPDSWPEQLEGEDHDTYMARVIASIRCGLPDETKRPTPPNPDGATDDD